jgi:hypothetical protein
MTQIVIGDCPQCGHALKVKEYAPRPHMHYTCSCGWHGPVELSDAVIARAEELRREGAGRRHKTHLSVWGRIVRTITAWFHSAS